MKINKLLYRVLSSKGQDKGVVRGFRVPKDFPLDNQQVKLIIANLDLIVKKKEHKDVKPALKLLKNYLAEKRKEMEQKKKNDS